jgi:protein neuralized
LQGYVFSSTTIKPGDRILVQILATEDAYIGSIAFGLTNCDPASIDTEDLPEDSDLLLDRPEYWVVSKDVANCPGVGDELSFQVNLDGSVEFSKNGNIPSVFMHVDTSLPLWAFWDVYGHTLKIRLIGSTVESVARPANQTSNPTSPYASTQPSAHASAQDYSMNQSQPLSECTICFEKGNAIKFLLPNHYNCQTNPLYFSCRLRPLYLRTHVHVL